MHYTKQANIQMKQHTIYSISLIISQILLTPLFTNNKCFHCSESSLVTFWKSKLTLKQRVYIKLTTLSSVALSTSDPSTCLYLTTNLT